MSRHAKQFLILVLALVILFVGYLFLTRTPSADLGMDNTAGAPANQLLPNGASLDLNGLRDTRLGTMTPPNYPTVNKSELGSGNPFK